MFSYHFNPSVSYRFQSELALNRNNFLSLDITRFNISVNIIIYNKIIFLEDFN